LGQLNDIDEGSAAICRRFAIQGWNGRPAIEGQSRDNHIRQFNLCGWRFVQTVKDIDSESKVASPGERFDLALSSPVGLLSAALFLYLLHAALPS
jgi:hypothetical protein